MGPFLLLRALSVSGVSPPTVAPLRLLTSAHRWPLLGHLPRDQRSSLLLPNNVPAEINERKSSMKKFLFPECYMKGRPTDLAKRQGTKPIHESRPRTCTPTASGLKRNLRERPADHSTENSKAGAQPKRPTTRALKAASLGRRKLKETQVNEKGSCVHGLEDNMGFKSPLLSTVTYRVGSVPSKPPMDLCGTSGGRGGSVGRALPLAPGGRWFDPSRGPCPGCGLATSRSMFLSSALPSSLKINKNRL